MKNGRTFYGKYASQKTKGWITATMVISIVGAATNLIDFLFGDIISIVSVVFYLAAAFTLLFYKNWMLPLVITIYSLFFSFMLFDGFSFVVGLINVVSGFVGTIKMRKVNAAYERFCKNGTKPDGLI